jgi:hypothetical protein
MRTGRARWLWLGGLFLVLAQFLAAVSIAYFAKDQRYPLFWNWWTSLACVTLAVAFASFYGAIEAWPFPPWARPGFPSLRIEIYGTGSIDTEREAGTGLVVPAHLRTLNASLANTGAEQHASLTAALYVKLVPGSWGRAAEALCPPPDWLLPGSLGLSPISMPFALAPGNSVGGQLVYEIPGYYLDKIAQPPSARLEIWDRASERRMSVPAETGVYDNGDMTPASGAAQVLGPEHELQLGQQADAEPASP